MSKYNHDDIVKQSIEHIKTKVGLKNVEHHIEYDIDIYTLTFDDRVTEDWMLYIQGLLYSELVDIYNPGDPYEEGVYLGYIIEIRREKDAL